MLKLKHRRWSCTCHSFVSLILAKQEPMANVFGRYDVHDEGYSRKDCRLLERTTKTVFVGIRTRLFGSFGGIGSGAKVHSSCDDDSISISSLHGQKASQGSDHDSTLDAFHERPIGVSPIEEDGSGHSSMRST